jgi:acetolactate synthase-1/2/3 large subunit
MQLTGSELFLNALVREGVSTVFGYPGGVVLGLYDFLYDHKIKHILVRHEQAAVHAAEGYARASGQVGVALVTSGPGATNTVTGLVDAFMDSMPIVVFTGQVPTGLLGNDAFQEADICNITRPITKHNYMVRHTKDIPRIVQEAFHIARTGRPGPVLVDLPKDVLNGKAVEVVPETVHLRGYNPTTEGHPKQIQKAVDMILQAKKPVAYVGGGAIISNASTELFEFSTKLGIPTTMTLMGLGAFPGNHPLSLGMLGMHGSYYANMAVTDCDLLIAIGSRFDDRVTGKVDEFAPHAEIIHIDIDPSNISKNVEVDVPIVGDVKSVLAAMNELVKADTRSAGHAATLKPWHEQIKLWRDEHPLAYVKSDEVIKPQSIMETLFEVTQGNCIVSTDVGQHQMWTAQFFPFTQPRTNLTSGGLGTMGYGFPSSMGAAMAHPDKLCVTITGDGGFQMNQQELATVAENNIPVKIIIVNNSFLGMVRQWQEIFYQRRYSFTDLSKNPNFVKLADAYGIKSWAVTKPGDLKQAMKDAFAHPGPVLLDVHVDREENVYPMVPPGGTLNNMLLA